VPKPGDDLSDVQAAAEPPTACSRLRSQRKGSAASGNLATNAGRYRPVLRYGNARDLCLGLERAAAYGQIWNGLTDCARTTPATIGVICCRAEGTLASSNSRALKTLSASGRRERRCCRDSPAAALKAAVVARAASWRDESSAFEIHEWRRAEFPDRKDARAARSPSNTHPEWSVLIELGSAGDWTDGNRLKRCSPRFGGGSGYDGLIRAKQQQVRKDFWAVREMIATRQPPDRVDLQPRYLGALGAA